MDCASAGCLRIFFIPFLARGHTLPCLNAARLFAERGGAHCTLVTTAGNSSYLRNFFDSNAASAVHLLVVPFPAEDVGLPPGSDCSDLLPPGPGIAEKFFTAFALMQETSVKDVLIRHRPDFVVVDGVPAIAHSLSIPYFTSKVFSPFAICVADGFVMNGSAAAIDLPHSLQFTMSEIPHFATKRPHLVQLHQEADANSCGVLFVNTFDELSPEFVEHFRKILLPRPGPGPAPAPAAGSISSTVKVWCIGPVQLMANKSSAVHINSGNWDGLIKKWLDVKAPGSVLYVNFGSESHFSTEQLAELALGLEECAHSFLWVVREGGEDINIDEYRRKVAGRGLVLTEWAPQVAILGHRAIGGFLTHCGWNSAIEAIVSGLPVIAWPLHSEQFLNEKFLVEILRIGLRILEGPEMRTVDADARGLVKGEVVRAAVDRLMGASAGGGDEEVRAMRVNAKRYAELARSAMEESGGSSYANIDRVIEEMKAMIMLKKSKATSTARAN